MESNKQLVIDYLTGKKPDSTVLKENKLSTEDLIKYLSFIEGNKAIFFDFSKVNFDLPKLFESFKKQKKFKLSSRKEETRAEGASRRQGGYRLDDAEKISELRSIGWKMIAQIGRKLLSGDFNLTTISIPISVCLPKSNLEVAAEGFCQYPVFFSWAADCKDPLERLKLAVTGVIASLHQMKLIFKPLNPILGETFELTYQNGVKLYVEQVSHHPPINSYYMTAPNKEFVFSGHTGASTSAGFNSLTIILNGSRRLRFKDGGEICFNTISVSN